MQVVKAGAYLWHKGTFVFEAGIHPSKKYIGLIRLGGHMEPGESPEECALREIEEETGAKARLVEYPASYRAHLMDAPGILVPGPPDAFLTTHRDETSCTKIYLAVATGALLPLDAKGLLFLSPELVATVAQGERSIPVLVEKGARHLPRIPVDTTLPLMVGDQVILLAEILRLHPDLPAYLDRQNR